jgi:alkylation response protein AidB-like acyl-CoA dehydrogenase
LLLRVILRSSSLPTHAFPLPFLTLYFIPFQTEGSLGCFAFTERGAGVLSGAAMETTAHFDAAKGDFVIHSPTPGAQKTWISQVRSRVVLRCARTKGLLR